ncbi:C40 family peptidase [Clostridium tagluense]|uniref:C40 family peptidase n=2 Tax=Clostridium tagluense TaxID=360422 RepID=UPI001CF453D0|nr:C40 family peptidase [Clostridium tagluense]MCB2313944.1 C40 family peptidase [Clostridium tagluense]MCB2319003.1 C40 family peptidase [Clostridium tagluense]MCB2323681.1 C40 family peptidase [Clostridium tagluense]MCB2328734.1 C40 family peptidase [Clostridium tagluense]MCB2333392.1 C40 family peptidase [Clostridium tagluense]
MRTTLKKRNPIALWHVTFILLTALIYMIFIVFSNFETPLNKPLYIANGKQYHALATGNDLVSYSNGFLGMQYLWGGTTPAISDTTGKYTSGGFDCSGFVQYIYKNFGIDLPRTSMDQINEGTSVTINNLQKGDLVFFMTNPALPHEVSHVGIYIGNNKFIHSPNACDVIKISELTGYYKDKFVIGKRIIKYT